MDENSRLDYFRSEFEGKLGSLKALMEADAMALRSRLAEVEKKYGELIREFRNLEMSAR